jgi:inorganic pyrophosphatase
MRLDAISIGKNPPHEVNVVIEVAIGGEPIKYEMDKEAGTLVVDRFLYTPMRYPGNYGFIPHTLSEDGDPCDVLVANTRPIIPGAVIAVRPIGVIMMEDEGGGDEKIIAVPVPKLTKRYENVHNYTDMPQITRDQIQHFFEHYKDLEPGKWVKLTGWGDAENFFHNLRRKTHRRFIQQNHRWLSHQGATNRTHLLFSTRGITCHRAAALF